MTRLIVLVLYIGNNMKLLVTGAPDPSRLHFLHSQFQIQTEKQKTELYRLTQKRILHRCLKAGIFSCFKSRNRINCYPQSKKFYLCFCLLYLKLSVTVSDG